MILSSTCSIEEKLGIGYDPETFELDFHPGDKNSFVFSTEFGLYYSKISKDTGEMYSTPTIRQLDTATIGDQAVVKSLSYSDQGFILAGFLDGSIAVYHTDFSSPLSVWY